MESRVKFMILVKSNPSPESTAESLTESALKESMARMNALNEELRKAGVMRD